jgi:hypothetical protein
MLLVGQSLKSGSPLHVLGFSVDVTLVVLVVVVDAHPSGQSAGHWARTANPNSG